MKWIVVSIPGLSASLIRQSGAEVLNWLLGAGRTLSLNASETCPRLARFALETGRSPRSLGVHWSVGRRPAEYVFEPMDRRVIPVPSFVETISTLAPSINTLQVERPGTEGSTTAEILETLRAAFRGSLDVVVHWHDEGLEQVIRSCPASYEPGTAALPDGVADFLLDWDRQLGQLLEHAGEGATLVLVSPYELTVPRHVIAPNDWFVQQGWLTLTGDSTIPLAPPYDRVDWPRTKGMCLCDSSAGVFWNIRGRDPDGLVIAEDAAEMTLEIERAWSSIGDLETLRPAGEPAMAGRIMPDVVVRTADAKVAFVDTVGHPNWHWDPADQPDVPARSSMPGFVLFAAAALPEFTSTKADLVDVAPTLLQLMGIIPPTKFDGRSLLVSNPVESLDVDEEAMLRDRLRGLGYIE